MKIEKRHVDSLNGLINHGLISGTSGKKGVNGKMCMESLISYVMLKENPEESYFGDRPKCVNRIISEHGVNINDCLFNQEFYNKVYRLSSSYQQKSMMDHANLSRASDVKRFAIAQLGSSHINFDRSNMAFFTRTLEYGVIAKHFKNSEGFKSREESYLIDRYIEFYEQAFSELVRGMLSGSSSSSNYIFAFLNGIQLKMNDLAKDTLQFHCEKSGNMNLHYDDEMTARSKKPDFNVTFKDIVCLGVMRRFFSNHPIINTLPYAGEMHGISSSVGISHAEFIRDVYFPIARMYVAEFVKFLKAVGTQGGHFLNDESDDSYGRIG